MSSREEQLREALAECCSDILKTIMEAMADPEGGIGADQIEGLIRGHLGDWLAKPEQTAAPLAEPAEPPAPHHRWPRTRKRGDHSPAAPAAGVTAEQVNLALGTAICGAWAKGYYQGCIDGASQPSQQEMNAIMKTSLEVAAAAEKEKAQ